jgi:hypothetical protein
MEILSTGSRSQLGLLMTKIYRHGLSKVQEAEDALQNTFMF